jgi:hypothetical protein
MPVAYAMHMARVEALVQLTDDLIAELDVEARRRGTSRSGLIREAIAAYLAESREARLGAQIVDGYRRVPQATPDEWGTVDDIGDAAARETLQRLDAEDRIREQTW